MSLLNSKKCRKKYRRPILLWTCLDISIIGPSSKKDLVTDCSTVCGDCNLIIGNFEKLSMNVEN